MNFAFGDIPIIKRHVSTPFHCRLDREEAAKFAQFETKFKKFLYCGVSVQHLKPNSAVTRSGMTRRETRTLWLMLPEVGSLRLGFVSKIKDNGSDISMDDNTVASSVASSRADANVRIVVRHEFEKILSCVTVPHADFYFIPEGYSYRSCKCQTVRKVFRFAY